MLAWRQISVKRALAVHSVEIRTEWLVTSDEFSIRFDYIASEFTTNLNMSTYLWSAKRYMNQYERLKYDNINRLNRQSLSWENSQLHIILNLWGKCLIYDKNTINLLDNNKNILKYSQAKTAYFGTLGNKAKYHFLNRIHNLVKSL